MITDRAHPNFLIGVMSLQLVIFLIKIEQETVYLIVFLLTVISLFKDDFTL